jgi:glycosyltransferase involved in cell wall biosynthesis
VSRVRVDIGVVTCQRPRSLRRLLGGIQCLELPPDAELRVVVVDNDADASAHAVVEDAKRWLEFPLMYVHEKRRGIPQARNAVLATSLANADFVAFIDDDEVPDPDWLCELLQAQRRYEADAVTGPNQPRFETTPPPWVQESRLFDAPAHATGATLGTAYTNNVLVATQALAQLDGLFDESMALIGGSDSELFERFARAGHRIVWSNRARTYEWIPASRAQLRWLLRRAFRVGASTALVERRRAGDAPSLAWNATHAGWCVLKGSMQVLLGLAHGLGAAARGLCLVAFGAGRVSGSLGFSYAEYRTIHGA